MVYLIRFEDLDSWVLNKAKAGDIAYHYDAVKENFYFYPYIGFDARPVWHQWKETKNFSAMFGSWRLETDEECPNPMFKLVICSNCNEPANNTYKFCPNCGCAMTGLTTEGVKFK